MMYEKVFTTALGKIHYWVNEHVDGRRNVVMLAGLTADHHLFDKQWEAFEETYNLLSWDAPGHAASRPFSADFTL